MIIRTYAFKLKPRQRLYLIPVGDVHFGCDVHDSARFGRLVEWAAEQKERGDLIRFTGMGDYIEMPSPSERAALVGAKGGYGMHETTLKTLDDFFLDLSNQFLAKIKPVQGDFLGLLQGHHFYNFSPLAKKLRGLTTDEYLADIMKCDFFGTVAYYRLQFPQVGREIKVLAHHGYGGARTHGAKLAKRMRVLDGFRADIVLMGHDDSKMVNSIQVLDLDGNGELSHHKVYIGATGSFQKGYQAGEAHGGYAEEMLFSPNDLGVIGFEFEIEDRKGKKQLHWRASV